MKNVKYNNTIMHYWVFGNGDPIVFLHGFLEDHTMWKTLKQDLIKTHQVILIDLPCHGQSRFEGELCSMAEMAEGVKSVLDQEKVKKPFVFGHSMGGYVGLELLKLMPIKLTLVHSNFWGDSEEKQADRNRVIEVVKTKKYFFVQEAIPNLFYKPNQVKCQTDIQSLISKASRIPANQIIAATKGMRDRTDNFELIKAHNIHIIQGEFDPIISTTQMTNQLKGVKPELLITLKGVGHMSIWEDYMALLNTINQILTAN